MRPGLAKNIKSSTPANWEWPPKMEHIQRRRPIKVMNILMLSLYLQEMLTKSLTTYGGEC
jgi:hypothetical protein